MAELNISSATTTNLSGTVPDFIVEAKALDAANKNQNETFLYFEDATQMLGYAYGIPEIFIAASALCTWSVNRGWKALNPQTKVELDHVRGVGNQTFTQLMWSHIFVKLIVKDSFLEIKRGKNDVILNMIAISPERVRVVFSKVGLIKRYDVWNGSKWMEIKRENMLHSSNKRIADQMGGTSQVEIAKKIVDAKNEALEDERIIKHRDKALGIAYYTTDKAGKIAYANSQIEKAVKNGEMVGLPKDTVEIKEYPSRSSEDRTSWMSYLDNLFYQIFGVPRSIASSDGTSEVGGKMGHVIFEPIYTKEQMDLEQELETQQAIIIKFNRPPSLGGMQPEIDESKNTGQTSIQPNDVSVTTARE